MDPVRETWKEVLLMTIDVWFQNLRQQNIIKTQIKASYVVYNMKTLEKQNIWEIWKETVTLESEERDRNASARDCRIVLQILKHYLDSEILIKLTGIDWKLDYPLYSKIDS